MSFTPAGYTILVVESSTLARRLQRFVPEQVVVFATNGFLWKPRFQKSSGKLGKKADPDTLQIRKEIRAEAAHAKQLIIATDSDPSGDFIAWSICDDLDRKSICRGNLQSLDPRGALKLLETTEPIDVSGLQKRLENRFIIQQCWNKYFPGISMKTAGLSAIFSSEIPIRTFCSRDDIQIIPGRPVHTPLANTPISIRRSGRPAWRTYYPLSTFGAVARIKEELPELSYSDAQHILQQLFETVHPDTGEGLISYPRTEHRSYFRGNWEELQRQWILTRNMNDFIPGFLQRITPDQAAHDAIHPLDIHTSPNWISRHIPSKPAAAYRVIHKAALKSLKMPMHVQNSFISDKHDIHFIPKNKTDHPAFEVFPALTMAELGEMICSLGVVRPSGFGTFADHALKSCLIELSNNAVVKPGPNLLGIMDDGTEYMAKLKQLRSVADEKSLTRETVIAILSS